MKENAISDSYVAPRLSLNQIRITRLNAVLSIRNPWQYNLYAAGYRVGGVGDVGGGSFPME